MDLLRFNCRVCKKVMDGKVITDFTELLPPGLKCLECQGCGILGIELIAENNE